MKTDGGGAFISIIMNTVDLEKGGGVLCLEDAACCSKQHLNVSACYSKQDLKDASCCCKQHINDSACYSKQDLKDASCCSKSIL